jgi:hypothetical protein
MQTLRPSAIISKPGQRHWKEKDFVERFCSRKKKLILLSEKRRDSEADGQLGSSDQWTGGHLKRSVKDGCSQTDSEQQVGALTHTEDPKKKEGTCTHISGAVRPCERTTSPFIWNMHWVLYRH